MLLSCMSVTTLVVMVQFAAKWLGYAALATIVVAPFLAAFRGSASAAQRRQAMVAEPAHAMVQTADQHQVLAQVCFVLCSKVFMIKLVVVRKLQLMITAAGDSDTAIWRVLMYVFVVESAVNVNAQGGCLFCHCACLFLIYLCSGLVLVSLWSCNEVKLW